MACAAIAMGVLALPRPAWAQPSAQPSEAETRASESPASEPPAPASQSSATQRTAAARALFEQGMDAVDARDFEIASDRLRRSLDLRDSPVVRVNLALALAEVGRLVEASEHLRQVQRGAAEGSPAHRIAMEHLAALEPRLGRLRVELTGAIEGASIRVDGVALPEALVGVAHPADPGTRRVSVHRGDRELRAREVTVESGETARLSLDVPPPTPEELAVAESARRSGAVDVDRGEGVAEQWWFWTILGVLAAGAAVGITFAILEETNGTQDPTLRGDDGFIHMTLLRLP